MPKIKLIVDGGAMKPGPAVAQQLGPMGINLGKVIEDVNKATVGFKCVKVPVELDVNPKTRTYQIAVFSPPVAELIKKKLGLEKASGEAGKTFVGNIALEEVIEIAKTKQSNLLAREFKSAVKLVVGTCVSLGVLINNKTAKEVMAEIEAGEHEEEIASEKTEVSAERKKELETFWKDLKARQEKSKKALDEAKAAEEAAKAAATAAPTAAPAAGGKKEEAPKKEEKKKK